MKLLVVSAAVALIAGCASSSGVMRTGTGTYSVSTSAGAVRGDVEGAKEIAYNAATKQCALNDMKPVVIHEASTPISFTRGMAHVDLEFRCQ